MGLKKCIFLLSLWFASNEAAHHRNQYCTHPYCGKENLACNNNGSYSQDCVPSVRPVPIAKYRESILHMLNQKRNSWAGGNKRQFLPALRMGRMSWSHELENFARLTLLNCDDNLKYCLSSPSFYHIGNNMDTFIYSGRRNAFSNFGIIRKLIDKWANEAVNVNRRDTLYAPEKFRNDNVVKAAILMMDRNNRVGCAALRYTLEYYHHFIFSCTFATDVMKHKPLYKLSAKPGSGCKKRDRQYPLLCAAGEPYKNHRGYESTRLNRPAKSRANNNRT